MPSGDVTRISIPTIENWNAVKDNITQAIEAALKDALPDRGDADRRARLEKELMAWRDRMFALAAPNLRVNGQNFEDYVEKPKHLPFDEALDRTVIALREQSLVSEQTIAERRRTVPVKVQDLLADLLERQRAAETPLITEFEEAATQVDDRDDLFMVQAEHLREDIADAQLTAQQLNQTVPHLLQRAQWAQEVSSELNSNPANSFGSR